MTAFRTLVAVKWGKKESYIVGVNFRMVISCKCFHSRISDRQWYVSAVHRTYEVGATVVLSLSLRILYCSSVHACIIHSTFL